jgi:hypothetical protein
MWPILTLAVDIPVDVYSYTYWGFAGFGYGSRAQIAGRIFNPDPDANLDPSPDPDQLQVCSRQKIEARESTTRTTCDSVNPYFGV